MPQPIGASLHTSVPLTNISIAYQQDQNWIANRVFPIVSVSKQFDSYYKYIKGEWFRSVGEERAPATESVGTGWNATTDTYAARVYAVHKDISDQDRANVDNQFNLDRDATTLVTNDLLLGREKRWFDTYWNSTTWATTAAGVTGTSGLATGEFTQFSIDTGDPVTDMMNQCLRMKLLTGYRPNTMVVTPQVHIALVNHPAILDRIKYTQRGFVSNDLLAAAFEVERYMVADVIQNDAKETADESAAANTSMSFVASEGVLLLYVAPSPGLLTVSAGYTFAWSGYLGNAFGTTVSKFREERIKSDRIECEIAYDMKVVATDLGLWLDNPLG